jgi:UMF1 family MFS transporter
VGPFSAIWLLIFALPLFINTPDHHKYDVTILQSINLGIKKLGRTFTRLREYKNIFKYLIAHMIYTDGLNTAFAFGGIYAAGTFHFAMGDIILYGIAMNIAAGVGAIAFGWIDDWIGPKHAILIALIIMMIGGIFMVIVKPIMLFVIASLIVGICVGPIQAASRSLMIRIAPKKMITEMFGLYVLAGRITAFVGPLVLGLFTVWFNSQRIGMSTILFFLLVGGLILLTVKVPKLKKPKPKLI